MTAKDKGPLSDSGLSAEWQRAGGCSERRRLSKAVLDRKRQSPSPRHRGSPRRRCPARSVATRSARTRTTKLIDCPLCRVVARSSCCWRVLPLEEWAAPRADSSRAWGKGNAWNSGETGRLPSSCWPRWRCPAARPYPKSSTGADSSATCILPDTCFKFLMVGGR